MVRNETPQDFLTRFAKNVSDAGPVIVYKVDEFCQPIPLPPHRRAYYKLSLIVEAEGILHYADKQIYVEGNAISFGNPMVPYAWERKTDKQVGYVCLFTEEFLDAQLRAGNLTDSPLFKVNGNPVLFLDAPSMARLRGIFEQMLTETQSAYKFKYDVLRNYIQLIIHEALKIDPPVCYAKKVASSVRISQLFLELLERQYPVTSHRDKIHYNTPGQLAAQLSIHPNHLNRALKEVTGKTTSEHLAARAIQEAKTLLLHTDWDIAEIGYCLGFNHPANFTSFYKRLTGETPVSHRQKVS